MVNIGNGEFNLTIEKRSAKSPNQNHCQYFRLYGINHHSVYVTAYKIYLPLFSCPVLVSIDSVSISSSESDPFTTTNNNNNMMTSSLHNKQQHIT